MFWKVKTQSAKFCLNFNLQRGVLESQNPKYQVLPEFQFWGGVGVFWRVKTQSTKFYLNFNLQRGVLESQNPKYQVLPKFQFSGVGWECGVLESQNPKYQVLPKYQFSGGVGVFWRVKTQSTKFCLNFNFQGGLGVFWRVKTQSTKFCLNFNLQRGVLESQNPKYQVLPKFQFSGVGVGVQCSGKSKPKVPSST